MSDDDRIPVVVRVPFARADEIAAGLIGDGFVGLALKIVEGLDNFIPPPGATTFAVMTTIPAEASALRMRVMLGDDDG